MPAQRSNIGRRTAALSVLVVLGFGFAGPAPALQFDTFGLSAIITAPSAMTSGLTGTVIRATAYPDVQLGVTFSGAHPASLSVLQCLGPHPRFPSQFPMQGHAVLATKRMQRQ